MSYNNAVAVVYANDEKLEPRILVIVNKKGLINLPGGMKDAKDKSASETALREASEETSDNGMQTVNLSNLSYLGRFDNDHKNGTTTAVLRYSQPHAIVAARKKIRNRETIEYAWMRESYLKKLLSTGKLNDKDEYDLLGKKYKMYGPCVGTFKKLHAANLL